MVQFEKIAPYLSDPMVLIGFVVFLFFGFCRYLLKRGIIPPLKPSQGYGVLRLILLYGFLFGIAIIILGFGLRYRSLAESEQRRTVAVLTSELEANEALVGQLAANLETLVGGHEVVARALRDPRFPILAALFPETNLRKELSDPTPRELAEQGLASVERKGLAANLTDVAQMQAVGSVIVAMIERTLPTMKSLADAQGTRYVVRRTAYEGNIGVLRRIEYVDMTRLPSAYADLTKVRANYDVVVANLIAYFQAVDLFFSSGRVNVATLTAVLTAERLATAVLVSYTPELVDAGKELQSQIATIKRQ